MNLRTKSQKGFTIVELLIVIVVIAILAAISIVAYTGVQENSRNTQRVANAKSVVDAANAYYAEKGEWPTAANIGSYDTVKVQSTIAAKLTNTTSPSDTAKDEIDYIDATSTSAPQVKYWGKPMNDPNGTAALQTVTLQ